MNLGRRAVNETEIIKRCYLPLLSVNPRSNKAAVGRDGGEERGEMAYLSLPPSSMVEWLPLRKRERERERESGGFLDDFLITCSQSRVSARRKRHFARTAGRQLARETKGWRGDACRNDPGFMLSSEGRLVGLARCTCRGNRIGGKEGRNVKVVPTDIYTRREETLFRRLCEFSPRLVLVILPSPRVRAYRCMINEIMKLGVSGNSVLRAPRN